MPKLTLFPSQESFEVSSETNLLEVLKKRNIYIKSSCGGVANCTDCIIKIRSGEDHLASPSFEELSILGNVFHITKERLACQTYIEGDVCIDISKHDKSKDQQKLQSKTKKFKKSASTKIRKKNEVLEMKREREEKKSEKLENENSWKRHWEKEGQEGEQRSKKLGGGKRPRPFKIDKGDNNES